MRGNCYGEMFILSLCLQLLSLNTDLQISLSYTASTERSDLVISKSWWFMWLTNSDNHKSEVGHIKPCLTFYTTLLLMCDHIYWSQIWDCSPVFGNDKKFMNNYFNTVSEWPQLTKCRRHSISHQGFYRKTFETIIHSFIFAWRHCPLISYD